MKLFSQVDFELFLKYFFGYLLLVLPFAVLIIDGRALLAEAAWQMKDKFDSLSLPKLEAEATTSRAFQEVGVSPAPANDQGQPLESYVYIPKIKIKAPIVFPDTNDPNKLLKWLETMRFGLRKVFLVQGEKKEIEPLQSKIRDELAIETEEPSLGQTVVI